MTVCGCHFQTRRTMTRSSYGVIPKYSLHMCECALTRTLHHLKMEHFLSSRRGKVGNTSMTLTCLVYHH
eukprot:scaffold35959_cov62-Attheya_sp.AAC.1